MKYWVMLFASIVTMTAASDYAAYLAQVAQAVAPKKIKPMSEYAALVAATKKLQKKYKSELRSADKRLSADQLTLQAQRYKKLAALAQRCEATRLKCKTLAQESVSSFVSFAHNQSTNVKQLAEKISNTASAIASIKQVS